jgi:hypothetical protein
VNRVERGDLRQQDIAYLTQAAEIDEVGTAGAEQFLYFFDRLADHAVGLTRLNLPLQLDEGPIGADPSDRAGTKGYRPVWSFLRGRRLSCKGS